MHNEQVYALAELPTAEQLAFAVDRALSLLTLHQEKAIRAHFGLVTNPKLEDVIVEDLGIVLPEALRAMSRVEVRDILREFL